MSTSDVDLSDPFGLRSLTVEQARARPGAKWQYHPAEYAAWVADMDFPIAPVVRDRCHRLQERCRVRASTRPAEQLTHLVREATRDRQPDETAVVVDDRRAAAVRMGLEPHRRGHDLERREADLEIDLHVVDRQRLVVAGDVEVRWLLVAHCAANQQPVRGESERAHAVFAVVQRSEVADVIDVAVAVAIGGQDRTGVKAGVGGVHGTQE